MGTDGGGGGVGRPNPVSEFDGTARSGDESSIARFIVAGGGLLLTPVFFLLAYGLGLLLAGGKGPVIIEVGLIAIPVVVAFIGGSN